MLLIYLNKTTSRTDYIFKHICSRILELEIGFTSSVEAFVAHAGPKLSYGKQALAGEFFVKSHGLLFDQGFEGGEDLFTQIPHIFYSPHLPRS